MAILFNPSGPLDVSSNPSSLPESAGNGVIESGAFARLKNLTLSRAGRLATRPGSYRYPGQVLGAITDIIPTASSDLYLFTGLGLGIRQGARIAEIAPMGSGCMGAVTYTEANSDRLAVFVLVGNNPMKVIGNNVSRWGITAPDTRPTVQTGSNHTAFDPDETYDGNRLIGSYSYRYTYAKQSGDTVICESNPSPVSATVNATKTRNDGAVVDSDLDISWEPSADPQVTHVRLYRTLRNGAVHYLLDSVAVGTVAYTDTTPDADLAAALAVNHGPPPAGTLVSGPHYNGILFIGNDNRLYYSLPGQPEYWPGDNYLELGGRDVVLTAAVEYSGQLYLWSTRQAWLIQGTSAGYFLPIPVATVSGARNRNCVVAVDGMGIFHLAADGIYLFGGGRDQNITDARFRPLFHGETAGGIPPILVSDQTRLIAVRDTLLLCWGDGNVLRLRMDNGSGEYYRFPFLISALWYDAGLGQVIAGSSEGRLYRVFDPDQIDDDGTDIDWWVRSKDYTLSTRAHFPRWAKYDTSGVMASQILLDDDVHQTHVLTTNRSIKPRLIRTGNGARCSIELTGSGSAVIYMVEME